jgi:serine/threonine protein kinase
MKIIDKNILKEKMLLHTPFLENNIVTKNNTLLVSVHNVFQNDKKTFIIMEYIEPQDLLFYIQKSKGL